jgi:hypothetical protein
MNRRSVLTVGNRRDDPRDLWTLSTTSDLKFHLFPERIVGDARSKAVDEAIAKHTGRRYR